LSKWDKSGNELWKRQYAINKYAFVSSINVFHNKYLVSGTQAFPKAHPYNLECRPFILTVDTSGNLLSSKYYTDTVMYGGALYFWMEKYNENELLVWGQGDTLFDPLYKINYPVYIGMIDSNYNFIWRTFISSPDYLHEMYKVSRISDGNLIGVGADMNVTNHIHYSHIVKYDSLGNLLWERRYMYPNRSESHYLFDFAEAANKDIIAVGCVYGKAFATYTDSQNCWFLRLDSMGKLSPADSGFIIAPTGILEIGEDANEVLQLYPNPASSFVKVAYNLHSDGVLSVYDIGGKRLLRKEIKYAEHEVELDVSFMAKGTYVIELVNEENRYVGKLMKE
jgi:Secretion system C-terminal sorting domain